MSRHMIRGWFTGIRWRLGQDGTRIREFGSAARISLSVPDLVSASSVAMAGGGIDGDTTGITDMQFMTTTGTTHGATRFTTATLITEEELIAADLMADVPALTQGTGRATATSAGEAENSTGQANRRGPSMEARQRLEATLSLAVRVVLARAPSPATSMADRRGAIRHEEASAWVAEDLAVAAGIGNEGGSNFLEGRQI